MIALGIALAGGFGAACRFAVEHWLHGSIDDELRSWWPRGTFIVNVSGSLLLGVLVGLNLDRTVATVIGAGFLGGYTTFSTYAVEVVVLAEQRDRRTAGIYAVASLLAGVAAAAVGITAGSLL